MTREELLSKLAPNQVILESRIKRLHLEQDLIHATNFLPEESSLYFRVLVLYHGVEETPFCECGKICGYVKSKKKILKTCGDKKCQIQKSNQSKQKIKTTSIILNEDELLKKITDSSGRISESNILRSGLESSLIHHTSFLPESTPLQYRICYFRNKIKTPLYCEVCNTKLKKPYKTEFSETCGDSSCVQKTRIQSHQKTCIEKYGVPHHTQTENFKQNEKQRQIEKFGCMYFESDDFKETTKTTLKEKYGVEYITQSDKIKEKIKSTVNERYGTDYVGQVIEFQEKAKETHIEKYGCHFNSLPEVQKKNFIRWYGEDNYHLLHDKEKFTKILEQYNFNIFKFLKDHQLSYKLISRFISEYDIIIPKNLSQLEIYEFAKENYSGEIIINDRTQIRNPKTNMPLEIDILFPEIKFGIEFNGNFYHSVKMLSNDKLYHVRKTLMAWEQNKITLWQVFSDFYYEHQEIFFQRLMNKLNGNVNPSVEDEIWTSGNYSDFDELSEQYELNFVRFPISAKYPSYELYDSGWFCFRRKMNESN